MSSKSGTNSVMLNGYCVSDDPKYVLSQLFASMSQLQYWSYDALEKLFDGGVEMIKDVFADNCRSKMNRLESWVLRFKRYLPANRQDVEKFLTKLFDFILSCENKGTLYGLGFSNRFGDKLYGNPEYQSIRS